MKIEKMSMTELKAYAYDLIAQREMISVELQKVNKMIASKMQEKPEKKKVKA